MQFGGFNLFLLVRCDSLVKHGIQFLLLLFLGLFHHSFNNLIIGTRGDATILRIECMIFLAMRILPHA